MIYVVQSSHSMRPPEIEICTTDESVAHRHVDDLQAKAHKEGASLQVYVRRYPNYGVEE